MTAFKSLLATGASFGGVSGFVPSAPATPTTPAPSIGTFVSHEHVIPRSKDEIAAELGWTVRTEYDEEYDLTDHALIDANGNAHDAWELQGSNPGTLISMCPGYVEQTPGAERTPNADQFANQAILQTYGDTFLTDGQRDEIETDLGAASYLVERTVLVEAAGSDEVWGVAQYSGAYLRITRADGLVINTWNKDDSEFPAEQGRVPLAAKTYRTVASEVEDDEEFAPAISEDLTATMLDSLLSQKAIGRVGIWGVLSGPLMTSQSVCFRDKKPYHVAPEGFIGQFVPPTAEAVFNFIVTEVDGKIDFTQHAL